MLFRGNVLGITGICTFPQVTCERQAAGCLLLLIPSKSQHNFPPWLGLPWSHLEFTVQDLFCILFLVLGENSLWWQCQQLIASGTNCMGGQSPRRPEVHSVLKRREVPREDVIPGNIPNFLSLRTLNVGRPALPLELLNLMFGKDHRKLQALSECKFLGQLLQKRSSLESDHQEAESELCLWLHYFGWCKPCWKTFFEHILWTRYWDECCVLNSLFYLDTILWVGITLIMGFLGSTV